MTKKEVQKILSENYRLNSDLEKKSELEGDYLQESMFWARKTEIAFLASELGVELIK